MVTFIYIYIISQYVVIGDLLVLNNVIISENSPYGNAFKNKLE